MPKWKKGGRYGNLKMEVIDAETGQCVATVFTRLPLTTRPDQSGPWAEGERNLALILAAPELVEELERSTTALLYIADELHDLGEHSDALLMERQASTNKEILERIDHDQ